MEELREKTIAALTKQVELLSKDGVSCEDQSLANQSIMALTNLLHELNAREQLQPFAIDGKEFSRLLSRSLEKDCKQDR